MVPVYFKMFQLIFNEKLPTSEVGSLILQKCAIRPHELQSVLTSTQILPKNPAKIYIKKI